MYLHSLRTTCLLARASARTRPPILLNFFHSSVSDLSLLVQRGHRPAVRARVPHHRGGRPVLASAHIQGQSCRLDGHAWVQRVTLFTALQICPGRLKLPYPW